MPAIRLTGVGCYFRPSSTSSQMGGAEAARVLLSILGLKVKPRLQAGPQVTHAAGGQILKNLSLQIEKGSVVFLTGASGAGKTTLLRLLAGVLPPTEGRIEIDGTVSALIDVGDDLEPARTGLENIARQISSRRFSPAEGAAYSESVVSFAALQGFEAVPVERYSSGMKLRLSIGMALAGKPDIVLIDDVLGVGDLDFQNKCIDRLIELRGAGVTMLLVLSDRTLMMQIGTRLITLAEGGVAKDGPVLADNRAAASGTAEISGVSWIVSDLLPENDVMALRHVSVSTGETEKGLGLDVALTIEKKVPGQRVRALIDILRGRTLVFRSLGPGDAVQQGAGKTRFTVHIPVHLLGVSEFAVDLAVVSLIGTEVWSLKGARLITLKVERNEKLDATGDGGDILVSPFSWTVHELDQKVSNSGQARDGSPPAAPGTTVALAGPIESKLP